MESTDFFGVSGAVKFDKQGNRMSKVVVEQLRSKFLKELILFLQSFLLDFQMVYIIAWLVSMLKNVQLNG